MKMIAISIVSKCFIRIFLYSLLLNLNDGQGTTKQNITKFWQKKTLHKISTASLVGRSD